MSHAILIFGLGFTGRAIAQAANAAGFAATVTTRGTPEQIPGVRVIAFDEAGSAIAAATHVVSTVPPDDDGDPVLARHGAALRAASRLRWAGYLSTTGVYGDRGGAWVDEDTAPAPGQPRSRRRLAAEGEWVALAPPLAVDLFRVAGIYGPGRSALDELRAGRGRRVARPGHAFGRIHRDDIAGAVLAAAGQAAARELAPGVRVLHLSDDEPAESAVVIAFAAELLGIEPPPAVPFAQAVAGMGEMGRSFWAENRRVASVRTQAALARPWRYPTYREGLRAILAEGGAEQRGEQVGQ